MNPLAELTGDSPGVAAARETLARLVARQSETRRMPPILLLGETGTGKGLVARAIHRAGPRATGPFVDVNCAAIPETLLEAEMFGFERGAFTDARQAKAGLFQAAHRGTIFLDEVGLLPEALQGKLLKVIEERAVRRLGSTRSEAIDVSILTATSEDLTVATAAHRFREDLYHRLAVLTLRLPPLRDRGADIIALAERFLSRACADYELPPKQLGPDARAALLAYPWPGNVRELINVMERVALLGDTIVVTAEGLGLPAAAAPPARATVRLQDAIGSVERDHLLEALRETDWNISRAAARLGMPRNTLRYRIEKHGLRPDGAPGHARRPERPPPPAAPGPAPTAEPPVPAGVRWDRRRVTLLRAALGVPAESTRDVHRLPEMLVDKVRTFGGRVEDLGAAAIVAAFGIEPYEDAPRRAALAAVAILKAGQRMADGAGPAPAIRIALHTGQFTLGRLGDAVMIDHETKGEAWAVLDALTGRAGPDTILVSEAAAAFLHRRFELTPVDPRAPGAGQGYRLAGLEPTGGSFRNRLAQFVGRQQEVQLLSSRLDSAVRGHGQIVGITGDAGIGKSRLLFEFRQSLADRATVHLEGHCLSYGSAVPYLPVLDILRASCGITDADSPAAAAGKLRAALEALSMDPRDVAPYLLQLLGLQDGTEQLRAMTPEVVKARTFEALRQMSVRRSRNTPLILVVEDMHWIDKTSEEYFASLAEVSVGARIILVATYRPGYRPPWIDKSYATQMALQPLAPADSRSVVESVLGTDGLTRSVLEGILAKAEGNPFFLEELARAVREQGDGGPSLPVPDTIEEVILARMDRLSASERKVLQEASVVGKDVPFAILQAVAGLPEPSLRGTLRRLTAAEFIYETSAGAELEYTFKHALTHEVAYGSLLPDQRRALHAGIMTALESIFSDRLSEQLERLAHHAFRGEAWDKAVGYLRDAGAKAATRSAYPEAVVCFEQALEALSRLPAAPGTLEQAIDARFELRNSLFPLGEIARDLEHLREAKALAEALNDERRLAWVSAYMARDFSLMGDQEAALQAGKRALAIAIGRRDFPLEVLTNAYLGAAFHALGEYRRSIETLRGTLASLEGDRIRERFGLPGPASMFFRNWLVWSLAKVGDFEEGISRAEEAMRIAEAVDQPLSLTVSTYSLGFLYLHRAAFDEAAPLLERSLDLCRTWNLRAWFPLIASSLGAALVRSGRAAEGTPFLEQAVERAFAMRLFVNQSSRLTWLGESLLLGRRTEEARQVAHRALELARAHRERGHEAYALRLVGEIAAEGDPPDRAAAEAHYRQAIALAEELEMRPLLAQCHLDLGTLLRRAGRATEARAPLAVATGLLQALEMRFWLGHAEAESARAG